MTDTIPTSSGRLYAALLAVLLAAAGGPSCGGEGGDGDAGSDADGDLDVGICAPGGGPFSLEVDNPYFPLPVGLANVLEGGEGGATVRVELTVLDETEDVAGVTTRVVEERESEGGELIEVSRNFFVQAEDGTVCYYGEDVDMYEAGAIVSHDGAWRAGVDGARPGIIMPADPAVGDGYDQEVAPGVAEDHGEITAMGEHLSVPAGEFDDTIRVVETSPLDTGSSLKVYVRGIGMALDGTVELVSH